MDHRTDAEMMETETQTATTAQTEELLSSASSSSSNQSNGVWDLLTLARHLINQGKPSQALQAVHFHYLYKKNFLSFNSFFQICFSSLSNYVILGFFLFIYLSFLGMKFEYSNYCLDIFISSIKNQDIEKKRKFLSLGIFFY